MTMCTSARPSEGVRSPNLDTNITDPLVYVCVKVPGSAEQPLGVSGTLRAGRAPSSNDTTIMAHLPWRLGPEAIMPHLRVGSHVPDPEAD